MDMPKFSWDADDQPVLDWIAQRVYLQNKNCAILVYGHQGSGKSLLCLRLAELLDPTFTIDRVAFGAKDFLNIQRKMQQEALAGIPTTGRCMVYEEMGTSVGKLDFATMQNKSISQFFQICRAMNGIMICNVPHAGQISSDVYKMMQLTFEMVSINRTNNTSTAVVKYLQINPKTGDDYSHWLVVEDGFGGNNIERISVKLPSKKLRDEYEKIKSKFINDYTETLFERLEAKERKEKRAFGGLTAKQEEVLDLLLHNTAEYTATALGIDLSAVYAHKKAIERKGITLKLIKEGETGHHYAKT